MQVRAGVPDEDGEDTQQLDSANALLKLIQRINVRNAGKRDVHEYDTIKEIEELHE